MGRWTPSIPSLLRLGLLADLPGILSKRANSASAAAYQLRGDFVSTAEAEFYRRLDAAVSHRAVIFTRVNLGDLFCPKGASRNKNTAARNRLSQEHVDFLLCDNATLRPLLAVELDDSAHRRPHRAAKKQLVDSAFDDAGLPLVRVALQRHYNTATLAALLD